MNSILSRNLQRPLLRPQFPTPAVKHRRYHFVDTDMTLCIGALAQQSGSPRIVLCFDSKVSSDEFSSETEYKFQRLSPQLYSLFAGAPGKAKELVWIYREFLRGRDLDKQAIIDQLREPPCIAQIPCGQKIHVA